jgi:N-methylhydantoinase B
VTLLTERRIHPPWGLQGGAPGKTGENWRGKQRLPAKTSLTMDAGERLTVHTPGGGGWGAV